MESRAGFGTLSVEEAKNNQHQAVSRMPQILTPRFDSVVRGDAAGDTQLEQALANTRSNPFKPQRRPTHGTAVKLQARRVRRTELGIPRSNKPDICCFFNHSSGFRGAQHCSDYSFGSANHVALSQRGPMSVRILHKAHVVSMGRRCLGGRPGRCPDRLAHDSEETTTATIRKKQLQRLYIA